MGFFSAACPWVTISAVAAGVLMQQSDDCERSFQRSHVRFVEAHYADSKRLGTAAALPDTWILGWSAEESGWGSGRTAQQNTNYFSWAGPGNVRCDARSNPNRNFGCFTSYLDSGIAALFSYDNFFKYQGCTTHGCTNSAYILWHEFQGGASAVQAFQSLADAGYITESNYGIKVGTSINEVGAIEDCLRSKGRLQ